MPQAFFRGPIEGISPWLMPVAHGLVHAQEELREVMPKLPQGALWQKPGGVASVGWHLIHIAGSTDRLFTYAHGQALDERQRAWLELERAGSAELGAEDLLQVIDQTFDRCQQVLRALQANDLQSPREVGAAKLPATMFGLLFHAAEHAQRHSGQVVTTVGVL
ncbi:MAG: DinB family protein, partial [Acidobacteriota bacterium]